MSTPSLLERPTAVTPGTPVTVPTVPTVRTVPVTPCTGRADLFFADAPADVEHAKALCGGCPVSDACLAGALERGEAAGVWGGQLLVAGEVVARKRPRGRPRKHPVPHSA